MAHSKAKLDTIFIVDSYTDNATGEYDRAEEIADLLASRAHEVQVVKMDLNRKDEITSTFQAALKDRLADGKGVMVCFNCPSGVSGGILAATRATEAATDNVTRKILLSCHGKSFVNRGFKRRGVSREGVRHVKYDHERGAHQQELLDLF